MVRNSLSRVLSVSFIAMPYTAWVTLCTLSLSSTVYTSCSVHIRACVCRVIRDCVQSLRCSKESESERDCWERGWFKWVNTSPRRSCQNLLGHWNDDDDPVLLSSGFILVWCVKNWSVLRRGCIDERVSRFRYSEASVQRDTYKSEIEDDGPSLDKWIDEGERIKVLF